MQKLTPLMQQYLKIKANYKDSVLLFQMGDFYECFFDDAKILAKELGLTLTKREKSEDAPVMAGFPIKALDVYLPKLVHKGYKVAVAKQVEDPKFAKGIVDRKVVEIVTSSTLTDLDKTNEKKNNILLSIVKLKNKIGIAFVDILQGDIYFNSFDNTNEEILDLLHNLDLAEVVTPDLEAKDVVPKGVPVQFLTPQKNIDSFVSEHFKTADIESLDIRNKAELEAIFYLLYFISYTKQVVPKELMNLKRWNPYKYMQIDPTTLANLEVFESQRTRNTNNTLLGVIDNTVTSPGARLLRFFILNPLVDKHQIKLRLKQTQYFVDNLQELESARERMRDIYDIERLAALIAYGKINPKQLVALKNSLVVALDLYREFSGVVNNLEVKKIDIERIVDKLDRALLENPSTNISEGNIFKESFDENIKELRRLTVNSEQLLQTILEKEKNKTGIANLKLGYNKVFGYYFEVPKGQIKNVPEYFVRKQTLVNAERFITPEIKELEDKILGAFEKLSQLEHDMYIKLLQELQPAVAELKRVSKFVGYLDVITTFAFNAKKFNYTKPQLLEEDSDTEIELVNARHPVVERFVTDFVENSITIKNNKKFILLTGPNMGGKSTFIRQVALIQLLAQMGSFVPAQKASLKLRDRIFARVGASDDISTGRSTFMVELSEVARIIKYATYKSLVILDEVGRGTNTLEGLALAYAISKYLAEEIKAVTIFATHYHELIELETDESPFINYKVDVLEQDNTVYFLHSISRGGGNKSYGIYIAKLVNLPDEIIKTAESKLTDLAQNKFTLNLNTYSNHKVKEMSSNSVVRGSIKNTDTNGQTTVTNSEVLESELQQVAGMSREVAEHELQQQLPIDNIRETKHYKEVIEKLKEIDPNSVSPMEALQLLFKLKQKLENKKTKA